MTQSPGPGWWLASDGKWYPPHLHPDVAPAAATRRTVEPPLAQRDPTAAPRQAPMGDPSAPLPHRRGHGSSTTPVAGVAPSPSAASVPSAASPAPAPTATPAPTTTPAPGEPDRGPTTAVPSGARPAAARATEPPVVRWSNHEQRQPQPNPTGARGPAAPPRPKPTDTSAPAAPPQAGSTTASAPAAPPQAGSTTAPAPAAPPQPDTTTAPAPAAPPQPGTVGDDDLIPLPDIPDPAAEAPPDLPTSTAKGPTLADMLLGDRASTPEAARPVAAPPAAEPLTAAPPTEAPPTDGTDAGFDPARDPVRAPVNASATTEQPPAERWERPRADATTITDPDPFSVGVEPAVQPNAAATEERTLEDFLREESDFVEAPSRRTDRLVNVAVVVVALALAAGAAYFLLRDDGDDTTVADNERSVTELMVGDCFGGELLGSAEVDRVPIVDCASPHQYEVFHATDFEPDDATYDAAAIREAATGTCLEQLEEIVGVPAAEATVQLLLLNPTAESWADDGDRTSLCLAFDPDGPLIGSIRTQ